MRSFGKLLTGLALLAAAGAAQAAEPPPFATAGDLAKLCAGGGASLADEKAQSFCDGFIAGTGLLYLELVRTETIQPWACAEKTPTLAEARSAFVSWAAANPDRMGDRPVDGFWRAMAATYPCPQ